ncbi:outer membrane beta-barrel protein [Spirosoma aerolatum]|uniref:outer membrane beta-barrel protein n=1 Tax=Spirosoma aerolatum TaxID=1211326 RepID=UPI0009ACF207|nr:outer membrane beta-barrel protein [Spirosoma aerolatum]
MKGYLSVILIVLSWDGFAQSGTDFYKYQPDTRRFVGLRVGVNYSHTAVRAYNIGPLAGMRPFAGFYIGGFFQKNLQSDLVYRLDANVQMKGVRVLNTSGNVGIQAKYYYAGFTPQFGLQLMRQLTVYAGPELNIMLAKHDEIGRNSYPVEVGATVRLLYSFRNLGVELSYFRSFTQYDFLTFGQASTAGYRHDFYNRNLQVGLVYRFN